MAFQRQKWFLELRCVRVLYEANNQIKVVGANKY